jgi:hypothetical protein
VIALCLEKGCQRTEKVRIVLDDKNLAAHSRDTPGAKG